MADFEADASGMRDASAAFQGAIDETAASGGGELLIPVGRYLVGEVVLRPKVYLTGVGRFSYGAARFLSPSVLVRRPGAKCVLQADRSVALGVEGLEFDGNPLPGDQGNGLELADCGSILVRQCKFARFAVAIETFPEAGSRYSGDLHVLKTMFRNNRIGLRLGQDSQVEGSDFSANTLCGAYVNAGQGRLLGCRFEWNRDGERGAADGIYLHHNANEITVADCTFDRNAGCDVRVAGAPGKRPRHVLVAGNLFKRAGWGTDAAPSASAVIVAADDVSFTGNLYQFAAHPPAPTEGMPSPLQAAAFADCRRIAFTDAALAGVGDMLALGPPDYAWVRSKVGWFLTRPRNAQGNPWLRRPEDVVLRADADAHLGDPRPWRSADWDFGDQDGLGYATLYLRDDPLGQSVHAVYAEAPVSFADCEDVTTDDLRDFATAVLAAGAKQRAVLRTRLVAWAAGARLLRLAVSLDDGESANDALFELTLRRRRTRPVSASCAVRPIGDGGVQPAIGVSGSSAAVTVAVQPSPIADAVEIELRNRSGRSLEAGLSLLW